MRDPIVEELHRYREEHARRFDYDIDAICDDLQAMQQTRGLKAVRLPPKRIEQKGRSEKLQTGQSDRKE